MLLKFMVYASSEILSFSIPSNLHLLEQEIKKWGQTKAHTLRPLLMDRGEIVGTGEYYISYTTCNAYRQPSK